MEDQKSDDQRDGDSQNHQQRRAHIAHKEEDDNTRQYDTYQDIIYEVIDRVVQQFRLVACDGKLHIGIVLGEVLQLLIQGLLQIRHTGIRLLDNSKCNGIPAVRSNHTLSLAGMFHDTGQLTQAEQAVIDLQEELLHILCRGGDTLKLNIILILAITDSKAAERDIHTTQRALHICHRDTRLTQQRFIRDNKQLRINASTHIDHSNFFQLLDALGYDLLGKAAKFKELIRYGVQFIARSRALLTTQRHIDIEGRDIRSTRLQHLRALDITRQRGGCAVNLFVNLDKKIIQISSLLK